MLKTLCNIWIWRVGFVYIFLNTRYFDSFLDVRVLYGCMCFTMKCLSKPFPFLPLCLHLNKSYIFLFAKEAFFVIASIIQWGVSLYISPSLTYKCDCVNEHWRTNARLICSSTALTLTYLSFEFIFLPRMVRLLHCFNCGSEPLTVFSTCTWWTAIYRRGFKATFSLHIHSI